MSGEVFHLAQLNIGRLHAPIDSPQIADFVGALDRINAIGEASPGFVWRLQDDGGNATRIPVFEDDDLYIANLTVWESIDAFTDFVYRSDHAEVMRRRREWFSRMVEAYLVLWWIPAGTVPTLAEAVERLMHLREHGPSPYAFTARESWPVLGATEDAVTDDRWGVPDRLSDEARATARLREAADALTAGVAVQLPGWSVAEVDRILDVWGRADPATRERARSDATDAGTRAATRVVAVLTELLGRDAAAQAATPLEIVRSAYEEPTEVLAGVGVPAVERDEFDERAWPDDRYGLVPRTLSDLRTQPDDDDLGPLLLVWGMAKAAVLRARAEPAVGPGERQAPRG